MSNLGAASLIALEDDASRVGSQRRFAHTRPPLALLAGPLSLLTAPPPWSCSTTTRRASAASADSRTLDPRSHCSRVPSRCSRRRLL